MAKEGSKADMAADRRGAKKAGMTLKQYENSPMDRAEDAKGYAKGGAVSRGDGMASRGRTKGAMC